MAERSRSDWRERGEKWAATAVQGRSQDDSFNQMIIEEAGIKPGEAVLDLASGTGNPAVSIALSMEGRGTVTCGDFTQRMLEAARERARNLELGIMRFACCDMLALPFDAELFDCVTCRFGMMSVAEENRPTAAEEALRVLRSGGRVAYVVWGDYEDNPPFVVPRRTVARFFGEEEGPVPPRHSMSAPGTLVKMLEAAGFERAEERELRYRRPVEDIEAYVTNGLKRSFAKKVEGLSPERFEDLKRTVLAAWKPFEEDGIVRVPNYARLGIGWKPA